MPARIERTSVSDPSNLAEQGEQQRLIAWNRELLAAHERLREALRLAQDSAAAGDAGAAGADLLQHCHGFCSALGAHHVAEDVALFPVLAARHPELQRTIAALEEDHRAIAALLQDLERALDSAGSAAELEVALDGIAAVMESHFRYEERRLLDTLTTLDLTADPVALLGGR